MTIAERVQIRMPEETVDSGLLSEIVQTACDRILMRAGVAVFIEDERTAFPLALQSIAVEVSIKIYRRQNFEGIKSESADTLNTAFVDDILSEYAEEIKAYKSSNTGKVRFI